MRKYSKGELAHLKWKLIKQDGLTPEQADKRIEDLKDWSRKNKENEN